MHDQAVFLPKWSPEWRIILAKGQLDHAYTFWTMLILIFSLVQIIMRHPLFLNCQDRETNSFVCFLGEVTTRQFYFKIYWPLLGSINYFKVTLADFVWKQFFSRFCYNLLFLGRELDFWVFIVVPLGTKKILMNCSS